LSGHFPEIARYPGINYMSDMKKIMVVEDDAPSALLLMQMLKKYGYSILGPVDTGDKAIQMACELTPDLILMDISLKGNIDGITAAQMIREKCNIPFIYTTVSTDELTINRAKESVPYGYIIKPYKKNIIYASVEIALYRINLEKRLREVEDRNRAMLASLPDSIFYVNRNGDFAHDGDKHMAGNAWTEKVANKAISAIRAALDEKKNFIFDYALARKNGTVYYEARIIPSDADKALVITRDVTMKKIDEARKTSYQKELKSKVDDVSRELATAGRNLERESGMHKKTEQNLKIFRHAIDQNPHLIAIINNNGYVEYVNCTYSEISGYNRDEIIGTRMSEPGNPIIPSPEIWNSMVGSIAWKGKLNCLRRDGREYFINASVSPFRGENDEISHYIITAEDITQVTEDAMALEHAKDTLDTAGQDISKREIDWKEWKEKMMERNVSRTDKSLFKNIHNSFTRGAGFGALVTLIDTMVSGAEKSGGRYIVDSRLMALIQNNVNLVKDAFKTFTSIDWIISNEFNLQKTSLMELYENAKVIISKAQEYCGINNNRIIINEFNNRFNGLYINLNKDYFSKAFYELLVNAMKFSKRNSYITVFVNVMGKDAMISIINDPEKNEEGTMGIPMEYEKVVFEPFYRLTKFVHEQYNTLEFGLGLTLVEKIVSKHGGEVTARNIVDHSDTRRESPVKVNVSISIPLVEK
jgi:PAS domain S-box-containing protein